jgi:two-component system response regulator YesN
LRDLIYGKRDDDSSLFAFMDHISVKMSNFITLIFDIDSQIGEGVSYLLDSFETLICEELAKKYKVNYLRTGSMQYTVLITLQNLAEREALIEDIRQLQESIRNRYGASFTVGVSTVKQKLDDIPICYDEAYEAIKHKNIYEGKKIIDILDIKSENRTFNSFPIYEAQMLVKKLRTSTEKEIIEFVEEMIGEQKNRYSMELLNAFLLYLSFCIGQVGIEYNISPEAIFDNTFLEFITEYDNIEKKKEYLLAQCKKILEARSCEQRRYKKLSAEIAIKYIQENYDKPISLDIVAYELNMSSSYLSRLIKEEIGQNFNTYLNKLRIDKAIELLQKGNLTNDEIAQKVGYENQHTFIRNFKKFTGKTPGSYKG